MSRALPASNALPPASPRPPQARLPGNEASSFLTAAQAYQQPATSALPDERAGSPRDLAVGSSTLFSGRYLDMPLARDVSPHWRFERGLETMDGPPRSRTRHNEDDPRSPARVQEDAFEDYDYAPVDEGQWEGSSDGEGDDGDSLDSVMFGDEAAEAEYMSLMQEGRRRARRHHQVNGHSHDQGSTLAVPPDVESRLAESSRLTPELVAASVADLQGRVDDVIRLAAETGSPLPTAQIQDLHHEIQEHRMLGEMSLRMQTEVLPSIEPGSPINPTIIEIATANELCGALAPRPSFVALPMPEALQVAALARAQPPALQRLQAALSVAAGCLQDPQLRRAHNQVMSSNLLREGVRARLAGMYARLESRVEDWLQLPPRPHPPWSHLGTIAPAQRFAALGRGPQVIPMVHMHHPTSQHIDLRLVPIVPAANDAPKQEDQAAQQTPAAASADVGNERLIASTSSTASPAPSSERPSVKLGPVLHLGQPEDNVLPCSFLRPGIVFEGRQAYSEVLAEKGQPSRRKRRTSEPHAAAPLPSSAVDLLPLARRGRRMASMGSPATSVPRNNPLADAPTSVTPLASLRGLSADYEELECIISEDAARIMRSRAHDSWSVRVSFHSIDLEKGLIHGVMHALEVRKLCSVSPATTLPRVTTVFEGEIIDGVRHGIWTNKWGCERADDVQQWSSLRAFEGLGDGAVERGRAREGYILMRWKERNFVNMDAKSSGLTISGFYHAALNRRTGHIEAIYFDPSSSPFQRMTLTPSSAFGAFSLA